MIGLPLLLSVGPTMHLPGHLLLLLTLLTLPEHTGAFFGWFTRKTSGRSSGSQKELAPDPRSMPSAPFEMITNDEKFLAEAKQLEMSPLDSCHYQVTPGAKPLILASQVAY